MNCDYIIVKKQKPFENVKYELISETNGYYNGAVALTDENGKMYWDYFGDRIEMNPGDQYKISGAREWTVESDMSDEKFPQWMAVLEKIGRASFEIWDNGSVSVIVKDYSGHEFVAKNGDVVCLGKETDENEMVYPSPYVIYKGTDVMSQGFARFLTGVVSDFIDSQLPKDNMCMSSYECELMEDRFKKGRFNEIERYFQKKVSH